MKHAVLTLVLALPGAATFASPAPICTAQAGAEQEIIKGRVLLDSDPQKALEHFEAALAQQADFATERWVIRGWIAVGRTNDALDRIQAMEAEGADGALVDYLFGYAFAGKAAQHVAEGTGGLAAMNFDDAVTYFQSALEKNATEYADGWYALAHTAWWAQQLDVARDAAEKALQVVGSGASPRAHNMLGKIAFSQYSAIAQDEAQKDTADAHWKVALDSFGTAIDFLVRPTEPADRVLLADASLQRAYVLVWGKQAAAAQADYARAMTYDPTIIDYAAARDQLGADAFLQALEEAAPAFVKLYGKRTQSDATLLWWLGYSRNEAKQYAGAEEAMLLAAEKWPAFSNAWWTIASSRYSRSDYDGATEALFHFAEIDRAGLTATIKSGGRMHLALVEGLVGNYAKSYEKTRDADAAGKAARLALLQAGAAPANSNYWNNAGLFYRDAGEYLLAKDDETSTALGWQYLESSLENYSKALVLEPENPVYLNDTAVILDYYLNRDLDRALEMYQRATTLAETLLAKPDLEASDRPGIQIALRDSKNNARKLKKKILKRDRAREREEKEKDGGDGDGEAVGGV